jgi:hypothetical protein
MTKRQIGIRGLIFSMIVVGIWVALPNHRTQSPSPASSALTDMPVHAQQVPGSLAAIRTVERPSSSESTDNHVNSISATAIANAGEPTFDRDFAAAAARPYVEMYQREHPTIKVGSFGWTAFQAIYAPAQDGSNAKGYIVVFFPASEGPAVGFTCFKVKDDASDHLEPVSWGYASDLARGIERFRRGAAERNGCGQIF